MKFIYRLGLLILFTIAGSIIVYFDDLAFLNGWYEKWEPIGKPPSKVIKLIGLDYVQTESGDTYQYIYAPDCNNNCWVKSDNPQLNTKFWIPLESCVDLPSLDNFVESKAVCELWGPGTSLTVNAIDQNGIVYSWNHRVGESFTYLLAPYVGAFCGFLIGSVVLIGLLFSDLIKEQHKNAQANGTSEKE